MDDQIGQFVQVFGARAEWSKGFVGAPALGAGHAPRFFEAIDGWEGDLVLLGVFARGLAERFGGFLHIEDVVHDLKGQADVLAVAGERLVVRVAGARADGARRSRRAPGSAGRWRPRRWRPGASWRAAERRSWRDGWIRATGRWGAGLRPPDRPPGRRSCRRRCRRRWPVRRSCGTCDRRGWRALCRWRPGLRRPTSAGSRPPEWPWLRRRPCGR